jgi:hypothetical protein
MNKRAIKGANGWAIKGQRKSANMGLIPNNYKPKAVLMQYFLTLH